jgi:hypothetical protein
MTTLTTEPFWLETYKLHPRNRAFALNDAAKNDLETLFIACGQDKAIFHRALDDLSVYGVNAVRPIPPAKREPPPVPKDAEGKELPNPWTTKNTVDQRAVQLADPYLAEHLREEATNPYLYRMRLETEERERLARNKANAEYDATAHEQNPFTKTNRAAQNKFVEEMEEAETPEKTAIYQREAIPVTMRLFSPDVRDQNRTAINQIAHDGDRKLLQIILKGQERRKIINLAEEQQAAAQRAEDARAFERQKQAHDDQRHNVERKDGRIITHGHRR